jgi:signal transduction histidine kinase
MSLRTRLLLAFGAVVVIPVALLAFGLRQEMIRRLSQEYQVRVDGVVDIIREDLERESAAIAERLASLETALVVDNRFRVAAVAGAEAEREYLLDYAGTAMRLTGLSMLQIQNADGRIISSGHFRNEHGRTDHALASNLSTAGDVVFVTARGPERDFIALARAEPLVLAGRTFTIVGGTAVDAAFVSRLARDRAITVSLEYPGGTLSTSQGSSADSYDAAVGELDIPLIQGERRVQSRLKVTQPRTPLRALIRRADSWFVMTAAGTALAAMALAVWVSSRISRRLTALAEKTAVLDLDRLDVEFDPGADEVGTLSRLLGDLAARLRSSTLRVRDAERRATVGELARQINHDIKNGLIPLRNVMRHLAQVERDEPAALPAIFAERRPTIDSSIAYLETLATSYQRLSPPPAHGDCDLNAVISDVVRGPHGEPHAEFATHLAPDLPPIVADPTACRRIIENLVANAVDSLHSAPGRVTVSTQLIDRQSEVPAIRIKVADTGRGMGSDETNQMFNDFYTTKAGGTGLGLSIVRRLVMDLGGTLGVESAPGKGTCISMEIPAHRPKRRI